MKVHDVLWFLVLFRRGNINIPCFLFFYWFIRNLLIVLSFAFLLREADISNFIEVRLIETVRKEQFMLFSTTLEQAKQL